MRGEPSVVEAGVTLQQREARHEFSRGIVPVSRDPGSGGLHSPLGGEVW